MYFLVELTYKDKEARKEIWSRRHMLDCTNQLVNNLKDSSGDFPIEIRVAGPITYNAVAA